MRDVEKKKNKNGDTLYRFFARERSTLDPRIRPKRTSAWYTSEAEARKQEKKVVQKVLKEISRREREGFSWGTLVDKWELALRADADLGRNIVTSTKENYISALRTHTQSWWKRPVNQITPADVRELYSELNRSGHSRSMEQKMRSALNGIYTWAIEYRVVNGLIQSPAKGVRLVGKKHEQQPEILTANEVRTLLESALELDHPWYPIWVAAVYTGMRQGELHALEWSDIDFENKLIYVNKSYDSKSKTVKPTTKGGWWRQIDLNPDFETLLKELRANANGRHQVLPRIKHWDRGEQARVLRTFCEGIGIPSVKFHTLRACFATILMQNGVPPAQVMALGGWKDQDTMAIYIRRAGIDIKGATASMKLLPKQEASSKIVDLFKL